MKAPKCAHIAPLAALLLAAVAQPGLRAQEGPYSYLFKVRAGLTAGDVQKTHDDNKVMGFAAEVRRDLKGMFGGRFKGAFAAELAWEYVPGRHHDIYPWGTNPLFRFTNTSGDTIPGLNIRDSVDNRKEYGQGINLKLAYCSQMPQAFGAFLNEAAKDMEWFAGLSLDRYKVRSEVKWSFYFWQNTNLPTGVPDINKYFDGGAYVFETSQFVPGAFAGLKYKFNSDIGFEVALRNFGLWHLDYTPHSYSDSPADYSRRGQGASSTGTTRGWALDFAITAKL